MVMFVLFIVLFATRESERKVGMGYDREAVSAMPEVGAFALIDPRAIDPEGRLDLPGSVYRESLLAVEAAGFDEVEVVLWEDHSVRVVLGGPLLFPLGSAEIGMRASFLLDRLALILAANERNVQVVGHTDAYPIQTDRYPSNWELSTARASAVARHLIERGGLEPRRFRVIGQSMYSPAGSNRSWGRPAGNRRVEIVIEAPGESP